MLRRVLMLLALAATVATATAAVSSASAFNPKGIYDCSVLQAATSCEGPFCAETSLGSRPPSASIHRCA